jgi:hypothetical protein
MKHCQECNLDFPGSYRFCGSCGGALSDSLRCPGCGELAESRWTFCTNCGRPLSSESTSDQANPPGPSKLADIPSAPPRSSATLGTSPSHAMIMAEPESEKLTPQEWYAAPDLFEETSETTATPIPRQSPVPKTTVAVPLLTARRQGGNGKTAPTLTMLSAYGESETTAPPEGQRKYGLVIGLVSLFFLGVLGFGGWYSWTHRASVAQSPPQADSTTTRAATDSSSSSSSRSPATTTSGRTTTSSAADEEFTLLRERRIRATPAESSEIITALGNAERKYPHDYRFPYERAKLSIKGITSHHEAFGALALAANKAIDNGKAQEMLDSLMADKDGDFYKLSRGHREWQTLEQALSNKDKRGLSELHH